jgi:hypothetical protein
VFVYLAAQILLFGMEMVRVAHLDLTDVSAQPGPQGDASA